MPNYVLKCPSCHQTVSAENLPGEEALRCPACGRLLGSADLLPTAIESPPQTGGGLEAEVLDALPADVADDEAVNPSDHRIRERGRRRHRRAGIDTKAHSRKLKCPNCGGLIRVFDQECSQCQKNLESTVLMQEETQHTKQFTRLRFLVWVFGLPGVVLMFATSILFAEFKLGHLHQVVWPILTLIASFVLITIGSCFEAATRPITAAKQLWVYGLLGLAIRAVITSDKLERLARIQALLSCRRKASNEGRRG